MFKKKIFTISTVMMLVFVSLFAMPYMNAMAGGNTKVYTTYVGSIKSFNKKNGKLSVRLYKDYPFEVYDLDGNALTERGGTKKNFKISKKCKWLSADVAGNGALSGFYDRNSAKKSSYRSIKSNMKDYWKAKDYDWTYGIYFFVKNGKLTEVVEVYS